MSDSATIRTNAYTLVIDKLKFNEFSRVADACLAGSNYAGETVSVKDGIVTIVVDSGSFCGQEGYLILPASLCGKVFRDAYDKMIPSYNDSEEDDIF